MASLFNGQSQGLLYKRRTDALGGYRRYSSVRSDLDGYRRYSSARSDLESADGGEANRYSRRVRVCRNRTAFV